MAYIGDQMSLYLDYSVTETFLVVLSISWAPSRASRPARCFDIAEGGISRSSAAALNEFSLAIIVKTRIEVIKSTCTPKKHTNDK